MAADQSRIRNFCIIAHIDHGKSTLADRIIEQTGLLTSREMQAQVLDNMDLELRKNVSFTGIPRFVMEVLSDATENYDRNEKMDIYRKVGVSEYWIVDWRKKKVEIFMFDWKDDNTSYFLNPLCDRIRFPLSVREFSLPLHLC